MASETLQHTYYPSKSVYNTAAGRVLVVDILAKSEPRPLEPHDYQLE